MARFNSDEGLKRGARPPATCMGLPVRGFLPLRALRRVTQKVPKPTRVTGWPRLREPRIDARSARSAAVDVRDVGRDAGASAEVFRRAGRLAVRTIVIEDRLFLGFGGHREEIAALVRE